MATLLYHWNFTGANNLSLNEAIYDSESNLVAKVKSRGTYSSSSFSRGDDGIFLNNNDSTNGGYYIELDGLNTTSFGGNLSIEMSIQNHDRTYKGYYFSSTNAQGQTTTNGATIVARFNNKTKFQSRPDSISNVSYSNSRNVNESSSTVVTSNNEFHYIFTIFHDNSSSSLKIYINGDKKGENTADLEGVLTNTVRGANLIGTHKEQLDATYLKGVVKYLKIYQGSMTDSEVSDTYDNYDTAPYYSDISSGTDEEKFTRRHTTLDTYFTNNPSITSFTITGNQLGLSQSSETYTVHKFTSGQSADISSGYHYVPLEGQNSTYILRNGTTYIRITQTSIDDGTATIYKYDVSTNSGTSYGSETTGKTFGTTATVGDITIEFGGVGAGGGGAVCFHKDTVISTDQGDVLITHLTNNHTIDGHRVIYVLQSPEKPSQLVKIEPHAFGKNLPSKELLLTRNHTVTINNIPNPIAYYINKITITQIDNNDNVYNIMLLNKKHCKVHNLDCDVINVSTEQLRVLYKIINNQNSNKNNRLLNCTIQSRHNNLTNKTILLDINKMKEFNRV